MSRVVVVERIEHVKVDVRLPWPKAVRVIVLMSAATWIFIVGIAHFV